MASWPSIVHPHPHPFSHRIQSASTQWNLLAQPSLGGAGGGIIAGGILAAIIGSASMLSRSFTFWSVSYTPFHALHHHQRSHHKQDEVALREYGQSLFYPSDIVIPPSTNPYISPYTRGTRQALSIPGGPRSPMVSFHNLPILTTWSIRRLA